MSFKEFKNASKSYKPTVINSILHKISKFYVGSIITSRTNFLIIGLH